MEKIKFMPGEIEESSENERLFLGETKDGAKVYNRIDDNTHLHSESGLTPELLRIALNTIDTEGRNFIKEQVNFDRQIGTQACVEVGPEDDIVMVIRGNRGLPSPMVKNREPAPSNSITMILKKTEADDIGEFYEMRTAYVGIMAPREPWDPSIESEEEQKKSQDFWQTHALIYDDELINWERTNEFNAMTDEQKRLEILKTKVMYVGLFINPDELYQKVHPTLEKEIVRPHVTMNFMPEIEQLRLEQLGREAKIIAVGYGNNNKNEGLLVKVEAEDPTIQMACDTLKVPHITLSISEGAHAKDTDMLDFTPLEQPLEITGEYGLFCQSQVITSKDDIDL